MVKFLRTTQAQRTQRILVKRLCDLCAFSEVSRVMAKVLSIHHATNQTTFYDPTCGSGSLLLKALDEADGKGTIYGQEKDVATAALNLFYGTGIPACIIVMDKESANVPTQNFASQPKGIFMVDASKGYIKDGNKNRLGDTAPIERWNNTLRQRVARSVRNTLSFSKRDRRHDRITKWFILMYNLRVEG